MGIKDTISKRDLERVERSKGKGEEDFDNLQKKFVDIDEEDPMD